MPGHSEESVRVLGVTGRIVVAFLAVLWLYGIRTIFRGVGPIVENSGETGEV